MSQGEPLGFLFSFTFVFTPIKQRIRLCFLLQAVVVHPQFLHFTDYT